VKIQFALKDLVLVNTSRTLGKRKIKSSEISTFQNRKIKMQRK